MSCDTPSSPIPSSLSCVSRVTPPATIVTAPQIRPASVLTNTACFGGKYQIPTNLSTHTHTHPPAPPRLLEIPQLFRHLIPRKHPNRIPIQLQQHHHHVRLNLLT
jgi:hypothetical protein